MSLAVLANHMASKGRNGDDMLVHMSKDEVAALQRLAKQHGLTLTINPETGLPEAFSLKSLLSAVAPLALGWALGPAGFGLFSSSLGASLAVGGIGALATGSLEKGLMMGLSAYGGSELGGALKAAGAAATPVPVGEAASAAATVSPEASLQAARAPFDYTSAVTQAPIGDRLGQLGSGTAGVFDPNLAGAQLTTPFANVAQNIPTGLTQAQAFSQLPVSDQISNIYKGVSQSPDFLKNNWKSLAMAGLPALATLGSQNTLKGIGEQDPSKVYFPRKRYNPYTGTYEQLPGFTLADYRSGIMSGNNPMYAADGGIVALADGGVAMTPSYQRTSMSPGMLDFANRSEPVVRMADGGATREDVINAYRNTAGAVVNPDESAINYWMGAGLGGFADAVSGARAGMSAGQTSAIDAARADRQGVLDDVYRRSVIEAPATTKPGQGLVNTGISGTGQADLVDAGGGGRGVLYDTRTGAGAQTVATQPTQANLDTITNVYRNVLGRDPDAVGLNYWAGRLASGESIDSVLAALKGSAQTVLGANAATLAPGLSKSVADAIKTPTTFVSSQGNTIADEWIRNTLGREPNAADQQQPWYQALNKLNTGTDVTAAYSAFQQWAQREKAGVATPASWFEASQLLKPKTTTTPPTITGGGGNDTITITPTPAPGIYPSVQPTATVPVVTGEPPISRVIPGTTGTPTMSQVRDAYTKGGGNIYAPKFAPKYKGTSGTIGDVNTMVKAYDDFWANTPVGSTINWAGGTLKRIGGGKAVFTGADGSTYELFPGSDLNNIAGNNPAIAEQWRKEFGFIPRNYVTGATLKAQNYLMGQGDYPTAQTPAGGIMKPYWETVGQKDAGKFTPQPKTPTNGDSKIDTSGINPNAPAGMQAAYDKWWSSTKVGDSISWAGGTLTRTATGTAVFKYKDTDGKDKQMVLAPTSRFEDLAANPLIAQYWKDEFGYDPTKHANPKTDNSGGGGGGGGGGGDGDGGGSGGGGSGGGSGGGGGGGAKAGGLMALARGGYAEGGDTQGYYNQEGEFISTAPADSGIAAAVQATIADSQMQGAQQAAQQAAAEQGIAALNAGAAEKSALAQAGYNPQTDTVTTAPTAEDYARAQIKQWLNRDATAEEVANIARGITVDQNKPYATRVWYDPLGQRIEQPVFMTGGSRADVIDPSKFVGAAEDQNIPYIERNAGQVLGKDNALYSTMEHGELLRTPMDAARIAYMQDQAAKDAARLGPYVRDQFTAGPVNYQLQNAIEEASKLRAAPATQDNKMAIAQQIVRLGYDPTGRYDPEVMQIVQQLKGTRMAGGGMSKMEQLSMMGGAAAGGQFDLGGYSDGGRLLKGPGDGVSDSIPATIGGKRPARLADGEFVVPARIVSELGNGSTDAGARKLYAMMDRIQANRSKTVGKGKVAVNSRADKYLPA